MSNSQLPGMNFFNLLVEKDNQNVDSNPNPTITFWDIKGIEPYLFISNE